MEHTWRQWEPQVIYVQHQSSPFPTRIWLPPFAEPIATHAPFLMSREVNTIGMAIAQGLEERGQVGATHMGTGYDAWYAGYIDYTPMFKNIASFWTETALAGLANTREYKIDAFPAGIHATCGRRRSTRARGRRGSGRCATRSTTWRPPRCRCSITRPATRRTCCSIAIDRASGRSRSIARKVRSRTSFRSSSVIRRPRSSCCGVSRSAAFASGS